MINNWYYTKFIAAGVITSLAIFYVMQGLISHDLKYKSAKNNGAAIDFIRLKRDSDTELKTRQKLKKPEPKQPPQKPVTKIAEQSRPDMPDLNIKIPQLARHKMTGGPFLGAGGGSRDGDVVPVVRIPPQYPRRAAMSGTEGWVKVEFTIMEDGTVAEAVVVDSKPRQVFDRAAIQAILKWKFRAKLEGGKPVRQRATQTIEFKLEQ
ncbi:MAG: energy transducer TonB [Gammaproteobacteria bacterium]|nr:energy transducer TonB [Gammaproteobacteria bacterium]